MCKNESTLKNLRESIPWRLFLGAFLLIAVLAYVFPIAPSGDGPYQTLNWISRIKHGQVPGRDFDVFHGVGVLWFHALLAWPFGAAREVIWVHYLGSLIAQLVLWCCVFRFGGSPWRRALLEGAALCGLMLLTMGIPFANVAQLIGAGHSMIGARVALPLICFILAQRSMGRSEDGNGWRAGFILGIAAGTGAWFASDQALASIVMGMVNVAGFAGTRKTGSMRTRLLHGVGALVIFLPVAVFTYGLLLAVTSGGALSRCLDYWWKTLPQVQFWYFGGAPNAYFHQLRDLLDPSFLVLVVAAVILHLVGLKFRKAGQWPLRLGLAAYGMVSLLPFAGMLYPHYASGLWCTGLIGVLLAEWPNCLSVRLRSVVSLRTIRVCLVVSCSILMARAVQVQLKCQTVDPSANQLKMSLSGVGSGDEIGEVVPEFLKAEFVKSPSSNFLRAFYRTLPEIALGQAGVGRFDYIIHALGKEQQADYRQVLQESPPVFLRVPIQRDFRYAQWLWHQWPELWNWILSNYQLVDVYHGSGYWRHADRATVLEVKPFAIKLLRENDCVILRSERRLVPGSLLHLTVTYHTEQISGPLCAAVDKLTRVTLRPSGVLDEQAFSWSPGITAQDRQVYLMPKLDSDVEIRLSAEGPILSSRLVVTDVVAEEVVGVDVDGLAKTLQP